MASDYKTIAEENIRKYGTEIGVYGPVLLANLYSDRTHFVYELLQNAEDAIGWRTNAQPNKRFPRSIDLDLHADHLAVRHYGLPFRDVDVAGICGLVRGTKGTDLNAIGKFGIGFKSVFAYCNHPEVHSGNESFVIEAYVQPQAVRPRRTQPGETLFWLPFSNPNLSSTAACEQIRARLAALGAQTMLFLRQIDEVRWHAPGGASGRYSRRTRRQNERIRYVWLTCEINRRTAVDQWLIYERPVFTNHGKPAGRVEVAYQMIEEKKARRRVIRPVTKSNLFVYFETEKEMHLGALVQGPYRTTPSRDNIPRDDPWNRHLAKETAVLLAESLSALREMDMLNADALEAMPIDVSQFPDSDLFRPLYNTIHNVLREKRLIPRHVDGFIAGRTAKIARGTGLRELLKPTQLKAITESRDLTYWVSEEITADRHARLHAYLVKELGIDELTPELVISRLSAPFLQQQPDAWIVSLYEFLNEHPALWRYAGIARNRPIIRLQDGKHIAPFDASGHPNVFLPGRVRTGFPTVKEAVCRTKGARELLVGLGLAEPDIVDDVIKNVLPQYRSDEDLAPGPTYLSDMERILLAFNSDSIGRRDRLIDELQNCQFIRCRNAADATISLQPPSVPYFASNDLREFFRENSDVWFVDDEYPLDTDDARALLKRCGVFASIWQIPFEPDFDWERRQELRGGAGNSGVTSDLEVTDYKIEGLEEFLLRLGKVGYQDAVSLSATLWRLLCELIEALPASEYGRDDFFRGTYKWFYYSKRQISFDADFVELLRKTEWFPGPDQKLKRPAEICFSELPSDLFQQNDYLQRKLQFRAEAVVVLAREVGIEPGAIGLLKALGLTTESELRARLGVNDERGPGEGDTGAAVANALKNLLGDNSEPSPPVSDPIGPEPAPSGSGGRGTDSGDRAAPRGGHALGTGRRGDGGSGGQGSGNRTPVSAGGRPFISYVAAHPDEEEPDPDGLDQAARMALEAKAIDLILSRESGWQRTPTHNPGFDLFEAGPDGQAIRWCEVKAMTGSLDSRPVGLSRTQFECARAHSRAYWLYAVERAGTDSARIVRIQDPAGKARTFTFDRGWREVAKVDPESEERED